MMRRNARCVYPARGARKYRVARRRRPISMPATAGSTPEAASSDTQQPFETRSRTFTKEHHRETLSMAEQEGPDPQAAGFSCLFDTGGPEVLRFASISKTVID